MTATVEDLCEALAGHLADGEVAVLFEIGHEKLRYLIGTAVHASGKRVDINLSESTPAPACLRRGCRMTEVN